MEEELNAKFTTKEFEYASQLSDGDGTLDYPEFMQMELLRLGKVDRALLDSVGTRFKYLDIQGSGVITKVRCAHYL